MRLVDSSAWAEMIMKTPLGLRIRMMVPERDQWVVPTLVQFELARWLARTVPEDQAEEVLAFTLKCIVVPLDGGLALSAARTARDHKLAVADAIIYAATLATGAELITCDAHFEGLPRVVYLPKP